MVVTNAAERPIHVLGGDAYSFVAMPMDGQPVNQGFPAASDILFAVGVRIPSEGGPNAIEPEVDYIGENFSRDERRLALRALKTAYRGVKANVIEKPQAEILTEFGETALPAALGKMDRAVKGVIGGLLVYKTNEGVQAMLYESTSLRREMSREGGKMVRGPRYGHHYYGMSYSDAITLNGALAIDSFTLRPKSENPDHTEVVGLVMGKILASMLPKEKLARKELKQRSKQPVPSWLYHVREAAKALSLHPRSHPAGLSRARQPVAF
jgi:hypothetical protein